MKCPNCDGPIKYSSDTRQFGCEYCGSSFTQEQLAEFDAKLRAAEAARAAQEQAEPSVQKQAEPQWSQESGTDLDEMNVYSCRQCGAEIVTDPTTAASFCPYCNSPIVFTSKLSGAARPDFIIPFTQNKESAEAALRAFYKGKLLAPKTFAEENRIKEVKGVYLPFWLFSCDIESNATYKASNTRSWSDSKYRYTETSKYKVYRSCRMSFENIPVDGSKKMDNSYMDAIEPFDYREMVPFDPAFLSGFLADKYDETAQDVLPRAENRIKNSADSMLDGTVTQYNFHTRENSDHTIYNGKIRYALFPVWMLNTKYGNENYSFAMNGQTGRLVGRIPVDKKKAALLGTGIAAAVFAIGQLLLYFM